MSKCINCGYEEGLHHYDTRQCPLGGEAPIGRKQEWLETIYQGQDSRILQALSALKKAKEAIRAFHGEAAWEIYDKNSPEMKQINQAIESLKN